MSQLGADLPENRRAPACGDFKLAWSEESDKAREFVLVDTNGCSPGSSMIVTVPRTRGWTPSLQLSLLGRECPKQLVVRVEATNAKGRVLTPTESPMRRLAGAECDVFPYAGELGLPAEISKARAWSLWFRRHEDPFELSFTLVCYDDREGTKTVAWTRPVSGPIQLTLVRLTCQERLLGATLLFGSAYVLLVLFLRWKYGVDDVSFLTSKYAKRIPAIPATLVFGTGIYTMLKDRLEKDWVRRRWFFVVQLAVVSALAIGIGGFVRLTQSVIVNDTHESWVVGIDDDKVALVPGGRTLVSRRDRSVVFWSALASAAKHVCVETNEAVPDALDCKHPVEAGPCRQDETCIRCRTIRVPCKRLHNSDNSAPWCAVPWLDEKCHPLDGDVPVRLKPVFSNFPTEAISAQGEVIVRPDKLEPLARELAVQPLDGSGLCLAEVSRVPDAQDGRPLVEATYEFRSDTLAPIAAELRWDVAIGAEATTMALPVSSRDSAGPTIRLSSRGRPAGTLACVRAAAEPGNRSKFSILPVIIPYQVPLERLDVYDLATNRRHSTYTPPDRIARDAVWLCLDSDAHPRKMRVVLRLPSSRASDDVITRQNLKLGFPSSATPEALDVEDDLGLVGTSFCDAPISAVADRGVTWFAMEAPSDETQGMSTRASAAGRRPAGPAKNQLPWRTAWTSNRRRSDSRLSAPWGCWPQRGDFPLSTAAALDGNARTFVVLSERSRSFLTDSAPRCFRSDTGYECWTACPRGSRAEGLDSDELCRPSCPTGQLRLCTAAGGGS